MIEFKNLTKRFDTVTAVDNLCLDIKQGTVLGLVGSNGSGKSTLLRMLSGVFAPDEGEILLDGESLFDNPAAKGKCYFIPDFPYFYNSSTIENTAALLRDIYPNWSEFQYEKYCSMFPIDRNGRIINMSKGMQRQAALILALSTCPDYLFLDEIFDGLDPVVRHLLKKILIEHVLEHGMPRTTSASSRICATEFALCTAERCLWSEISTRSGLNSERFRSRSTKFRMCRICSPGPMW